MFRIPMDMYALVHSKDIKEPSMRSGRQMGRRFSHLGPQMEPFGFGG